VRSTPFVRRFIPGLALFALICAAAALYVGRSGERRGGTLAELGRSGALVRTFAPRLSQSAGFRPCVASTSPGATIPRAECAGDARGAPRRILELSVRAANEVRESASPQALHASALIDLVWSDTAGIPLERSISFLQTASRVSERPAAALADLAAAHLVRAGRTQSARDLLEAVEAAERSLAAEPGNPVGLFNLALALEWLGVDEQARGAWRAFLAVDSTSGWAGEARDHLRAERGWTAPPLPAPGASERDIARYAALAPQEARIHGWNVALGEWGSAVLRGDTARASQWLRMAEILGRELERRGGDATLIDAVRAIRAARGHGASRALAEAHRAFAAGQAAIPARFKVADAEFARVEALRTASQPLTAWARRGWAGAAAGLGRMEEAEHALDSLVSAVDTTKSPALAGHTQWALATTRLRMGRYQGALEAARGAVRLLGRAREEEGMAGALYVQADAEYALGTHGAAYASVHRTLLALRPNPTSVWRANALSSGARVATADGLMHAALRLHDERVTVAERARRDIPLAEARIARAEVRHALGDDVGAAADLRAGDALTRRMTSADARSWLTADLQLARADVALRREPSQAAATLDTVIAASEGPRPVFRRIRALVARADARLALGNVRGAMGDLESATGLLDEQRAALASAPLRASLLDAARSVFDRVVMLKVAAGDTAGALSYMERSRASLVPTHARGRAAEVPPRMPKGRAAVSYALIGDTLLAWTMAGDGLSLTRTAVRQDSLRRRIERVQAALEVRAGEAAVREDLEVLFDQLIRPLAARLGPDGNEVVIVADGELAGVPFAALRDSARRRYLVESYATSFTGTMQEALGGRVGGRGRGSVLLVADPAFAAEAHPGLSRLPAARAEVETLASRAYPGATVLEGAEATPSAFLREIGSAEIVHFAGHATFDDARPERSHLVLASDPGVPERNAVTASALGEMKLNQVRLVVLSACQTLRAGSGRSGGFAGFAGALMGAGAGGVLGSLWRVDDELTGRMMDAFHQSYREHGHAPRALRSAQLHLLQSADPALGSPAAWAGFRYAGRQPSYHTRGRDVPRVTRRDDHAAHRDRGPMLAGAGRGPGRRQEDAPRPHAGRLSHASRGARASGGPDVPPRLRVSEFREESLHDPDGQRGIRPDHTARRGRHQRLDPAQGSRGREMHQRTPR
jgi:CHAT domain-containing protein